jgi:hypothetical protein
MKLSIDKDAPLYPGDKVELKFKWLFSGEWLKAAQIAFVESQLKRKYDQFEILSYDTTSDPDYFTVQVQVKGA